MEGPAPESRAVEEFRLHLANVRSVDVAELHALSMSVGWPHRAEDWDFLRNVGEGVAALDDIGRVLGSAMWFPHGQTFATFGMVITSPRLQTLGAGHWLMKRALTACKGRNIRLNATRAARRLYLSLDFVPERTVFQCQGEARAGAKMPYDIDAATTSRLEDLDLAAVVDLDSRAFGLARAALIGRLFAESVGYGLFRDGVLDAFALCRRFGRGRVIGPVVAKDDAAAIAVVQPHVAEHDGSFLRLDTYREHGAFATFLTRSGLNLYDTVLTMSFAQHPTREVEVATRPEMAYGIASQALG